MNLRRQLHTSYLFLFSMPIPQFPCEWCDCLIDHTYTHNCECEIMCVKSLDFLIVKKIMTKKRGGGKKKIFRKIYTPALNYWRTYR